MNVIQVSSDDIIFTYASKGHLQSQITIKNQNDTNAYFKFKVTRPKYYLIKPDHGFCDAKSSLKISITIHQHGVNEGESDKVKLYYKFVGKSHNQPTKGWEKQQPQIITIRLPVVIAGLPEQFKKQNDKIKSSQVKSLANSKFEQSKQSNSSPIQNSIKQKEGRLNILKNQIEQLKKGGTQKLGKSAKGIKEYVIVGVVGLIIGLTLTLLI